jgi:hypothetical protein
MHPRLQALVRVDLSRSSAIIDVRGSFTTTNYRGLLPVTRRAHALPGHPSITVDLTRAPFTDPKASELLIQACSTVPSLTNTDAFRLRTVDSNAFIRRERTARMPFAAPVSSYSLAF